MAREIVGGVENGILIEGYPEYPKGASVLMLQTDKDGQPVHVVWGIPKVAARGQISQSRKRDCKTSHRVSRPQ